MLPLLRELVLALGGSLPASIAVKATIIAALALIGTRLARRSRAAVRHVLLAAAFGALLLLPVASMVAPPVRIAVRNSGQNQVFAPTPSGVDTLPSFVPADARPAVGPAVSQSVVPWSELWIIVWFAGLAVSMIPMVVGLWKIRSLRRSGLPWLDGQRVVNRLAIDTGFRRRVEVLIHEALPGPIVAGMLHPAVLLSLDAQGWEQADLNRALMHELEHVRRCDVVVHSLARVVCAVYWFHPLVWIMWRGMTLEAERSCDDAVITRWEAIGYADQLVVLARHHWAAAKSPVVAMANRSDLAIRVKAMLDSDQRRGRAGVSAAAVGWIGAVVLVLTMSPIRLVSELQSAPSPRLAAGFLSISTGTSSPSFEVATIKLDRYSGPTAAIAASATPEGAESGHTKFHIDEVTFEGAEHLPQWVKAQLTHQVETPGSGITSVSLKDYVEAQQENVWEAIKNCGYFFAAVDAKPSILSSDNQQQHVAITFQVSEGHLFRLSEIQLVNAHAFPSAELRKYFPVRDGDPFSVHAIRMGFDAMTSLYGQHGYLNFTAYPDIRPDHQRQLVSVAVDLEEGQQFRIGSVQVIGLDRALSGETLKTQLRPGEVFNSALVDRVFEENKSTLPADASPRHDLQITQNSRDATVALRFDFRRSR